ncbi:MAG: helix-turn-helix domain-containing protein [Lawsonibacter sp.]|nr:helix-turn-helix domain-containing protein [Lawsonibacter sp.]MCI9671015.1 helix-turn-helix domain-containing protein [Lawsonibacter sp.]
MDKLTYSITETAQVLGISRPKVYDLLHRDDFPAFHVGGRILVSVEGLRRWVTSQVSGAEGGTENG